MQHSTASPIGAQLGCNSKISKEPFERVVIDGVVVPAVIFGSRADAAIIVERREYTTISIFEPHLVPVNLFVGGWRAHVSKAD